MVFFVIIMNVNNVRILNVKNVIVKEENVQNVFQFQ